MAHRSFLSVRRDQLAADARAAAALDPIIADAYLALSARSALSVRLALSVSRTRVLGQGARPRWSR